MDINIEEIPFGVVILKKPTLVIESANHKFCKLFLLEKYECLPILQYIELYFLKDMIGKIDSDEYRINNIGIRSNCTVDIVFKSSNEKIVIFFQETDYEIMTQKDDSVNKMLKLEEERQQIISMSTELKAKCDIIQILRNREKEYMMHLKDVLSNISEGLIVLDFYGKYSFSNKIIFSILDVDISSLMDYPNIFRNYIIDEIDNYSTEDKKDIFNYKKTIRNLIIPLSHKVTGEKKYIEFSNNSIRNENDDFLYSIVTLKDVTLIKLHEMLVQQQSGFIKDVVNTMDIPIGVITYPQMEVTLVNNKLKSVFKTEIGKIVSQDKDGIYNIKQILEDDKYKELTGALLKCGNCGVECSCSPFELMVEDEKRYYKVKYKPLKDMEKNTNLILLSAIDITEETCHSIEVERLTKLKDEFFTVISHELRTPLTVIHSSLQLAYSVYGKEITPNIRKNLLRISQNCSRLLKLINNVLDISKAEAGFVTLNNINFDIVEITENIVNSINTYAKVKEIDLIFESNCSKLVVGMDKDKYEKVLLNLLSNALKFTPAGKEIKVTIREASKTVILTVKDDGIGIPEDKRNSIFDRFAQVNSSLSRRAEGTGLGLALVKKFVDVMEGTIELNSIIDYGTEFILTFDKRIVDVEEKESFLLMADNVSEKINLEFSDVD